MAIEVVLASAPEAWALDSPADMLEASLELADRGWRGAVSFWHEVVEGVPDGPVQWYLTLNGEVGITVEVRASIGDRLLLSGGVLQCLSADDFREVTA